MLSRHMVPLSGPKPVLTLKSRVDCASIESFSLLSQIPIFMKGIIIKIDVNNIYIQNK